jgi:hypothetical protein
VTGAVAEMPGTPLPTDRCICPHPAPFGYLVFMLMCVADADPPVFLSFEVGSSFCGCYLYLENYCFSLERAIAMPTLPVTLFMVKLLSIQLYT